MSISGLNRITGLLLADDFPVVSTRGGGDQKASISDLLDLLQANIEFPALVRQGATPTATGFNVGVTAANTWLILTPLAGYAAGTITLPSVKIAGQEVLVNSTQSVTALTVSGNGSSVVGAPTTMAANAFFRLRYDDFANTWYRVG